MFTQITPLILTFNEAPNVARALERLKWAKEIVVVDSGSTDETLEILRRWPQVRVVQRRFDSFAVQCNFGLEQIRTPWVLSLDADYILTPELVAEIARLDNREAVAGYTARFRYCIQGRPLRSTLYPPRTVLYRRDKASYRADGHGHRVQVDGPTRMLASVIDHDDRKPMDRWLHEQNRYAAIEARHLLANPRSALSFPDRLRCGMVFAPAAVFFYTLIVKGLILDGWPGWFYVLQRTYAELLLALKLVEEKLRVASGEPRAARSEKESPNQ
ncbi:MAG: glycosyltransferase family 2 protein [Verrucomicrobiae bacterium]|nr:glycosyltransferase family 2 protein [Verrucomicrobiae bacterium]